MYHLRQVQIDAMTRYDYLGVIGLDRCSNGCVYRLRPPLHRQKDDIITRLNDPMLKKDSSCFQIDSIRYEKFNDFQNPLPKDVFQSKIHPIDLKTIRSQKIERQLRDLDKADQVNHSAT